MNKVKDNIVSAVKNLFFTLEICFKATHKYFIYKVILLVLGAVMPIASAYMLQKIIDFIVYKDSSVNALIACVCLYIVFLLYSSVAGSIDAYVNNFYYYYLNKYKDDLLIEKCSRVDLAFYDSSSMKDKLNYAMSGFSSMDSLAWSSFEMVSQIINVVLSIYIVARLNIWLAVLGIIMVIPEIVFDSRNAKRSNMLEKELSTEERKKSYYDEVFGSPQHQFEIRLNNLFEFFSAKFKQSRNVIHTKRHEYANKALFSRIAVSSVSVLGRIAIIFYSVVLVVKGMATVGSLQYNISVFGNIQNSLSALSKKSVEIWSATERLNELKEFLKLKTIAENSGRMKLSSPVVTIEFKNVWFKYPNAEDYVLRGCSFFIDRDQKVCFVGGNGSGKTTIVKLILRLYDVNKGEILINGVNVKEYDVYSLRSVFGILFQDYIRYSLPLREAIALSDMKDCGDDIKLQRACEKTGFNEIISGWDGGFDSVLGREFSDDVHDLSGGQWQLLSLTRAYFRDKKVMILDEPSAALDPAAENLIFNQVYKNTALSSAVMISHRLSNTILADKIFVVADGKIGEEGNHDDLIKLSGEYSHLFNLQAKRYM